jgi:soluble lytic murein transglycosylase
MRIYKLLIIFLVLLSLSCFAKSASSDNLPATGFYSSAEKIIEKLDNDNAGFKEHFLLGMAYKKIGEQKKAILHFANSCFKFSKNTSLTLYPYTVYKYVNGFHIKSEFYDDAIYEIAALFYEYREFDYVIKFVGLINKSDSLLFRDAALVKSKAMMELGKLDEVISYLRELSFNFNDINSKSIIHIRIASAFEKKEDAVSAVKEYLDVLKLSPMSWQSGISCDRIIGLNSKNPYGFKNDEELLLAASLYHNSKYEASLEVLKKLLGRETDENSKSQAVRYAVKNYIRIGKTGQAEKLISDYKNENKLYYNLLKTEADEFWAMKKKQPAYNIYQKLYTDASEEILKESHKRIIQYLVSNNSFNENLITEFKNKYPKDKATEYFLWAIARNKIKAQDNKPAIKFLEEAVSLFPNGPYSGGVRFWLVKLYGINRENEALRLQKIKEMALLNPDSAYTWKLLDEQKDKYKPDELRNMFAEAVKSRKKEDALFSHILLFIQEKNLVENNNRILAMDFIETLKRYRSFEDNFISPELESAYKDSLKGIEKYFTIGYTEGINRELGIIPDKDRESRIDKFKMLAYLGAKYNNYYLGATSIIKLLRYYNIKENIALLSGDVITGLLPKAFSEEVEAVSGQSIPKEMVYAVMKAESTFNHKAVSSAGATGLMQLMPATAKDIAKQLKIKDFDLKDPAVSISFGVKYLAWLNKYFKGDFEAMMAGYNAGAGNVKRWLNNFNSTDDDYLTEFIPFEETRSYILRTKKFFIQYGIVYRSN